MAQNPEGPTTPAITEQEAAARPLQHLSEAERLLNDSHLQSLKKKEAKESAAKLRDHFTQLKTAYQASRTAFVPPAIIQDTDLKPDAESPSRNWKMSFTDVENDLARILGGESALPPSTPTGAATISTPGTESSTAGAGSVGTSGTATSPGIPGATESAQTTAATTATPSNAPGTTVVGSEATQTAAGTPAGTGETPADIGVAPVASLSTVPVVGVGDIGIKDLDPAARHQLEQFRLEVELFFAAATMDFETETAP